MPINFISVIKALGQSGTIASTVSSLIKEYKKIKESPVKDEELKAAIELQSKINEKLESQIELLTESIKKIQKSLKVLFIVVVISLALIFLSLALIIFI